MHITRKVWKEFYEVQTFFNNVSKLSNFFTSSSVRKFIYKSSQVYLKENPLNLKSHQNFYLGSRVNSFWP